MRCGVIETLKIGLSPPREQLYERLDRARNKCFRPA